ncbi:CACTA en-spm transposon protein [Cucumis melo var. makuwa]|uniref:CACTA en-spm transposon protein n=1 Tax=Cucumis melo var. makuwa TaxID=1194695 RepID=A0A5A7UFP0_CUCMM|nr:CACTA en-spm transposon protein [Cucumis melo var. makuwa]
MDEEELMNLSASDYPLMTQDDLFHVFSNITRNFNFIEHSQIAGWKLYGSPSETDHHRSRSLLIQKVGTCLDNSKTLTSNILQVVYRKRWDVVLEENVPYVLPKGGAISKQMTAIEEMVAKVGNRLVKPYASYTLTNSERVEFCKFLKSVLELRECANLSNDFFSLGMRPSFDVRCYNGCIMSGLRFHMSKLDSRRTTQNSGIMVIGRRDASGSGDNNLYGAYDILSEEMYGYLSVGEVEDVENDHINVLEIVVSHRVDDHIEDNTLCRTDVDPTIVETPVVRHITDDLIDDVNEHLSHASIMSYQHNNFLEMDAMFFKFDEDLDNLAEGSSSLGDNVVNGCILMTIAPGAKKPISPYVVRFSQAIGMCVQKTFPIRCLKWADVGREYIEVVKGDLQVIKYDEHQMLITFKEFQADCHRHFKKYSDPKEARANPPNVLVEHHED